MASIKMAYVVQTCPRCGTQLLKVAAGAKIIGSPLLTCKGCGETYKTDMRVEWHEYPSKWTLWGVPLIILGIGLLVALFVGGEILVGLIAAFFGFMVGLCFTIKDIIRMMKSKKRMRNPEYLAKLLSYGLISTTEYERFMRRASGKKD